MINKNTPFYEWPEISFDQMEKENVDDGPAGFFYKSFFSVLRLPQTIFEEFCFLMTSSSEKN